MNYKDYYKILGVERGADADEIKRSYRKLARKYHPDVSKESDAEKRFKEVNEAYEVLKDKEKRQAYDQLGANWKQGQDFRPPPDWESQFHTQHGGHSGFGDFFDTLFGDAGGSPFGGGRRGRRGPMPQRGEDATTTATITLEEAFTGTSRNLRLQIPSINQHGQREHRSKTLKVKIPAGVSDGQRIRLGGQGAEGSHGGKDGDLFVEVRLQPHPWFKVEGRDITLELPIAPWEAALGATIKVPTLGGAVDLKIPAGSQSGKRLRLKGRGLPGKVPGDQYVQFLIHTPPADSDKEAKWYRDWAKKSDFNPRERFGGTK